MNLSPAWVPYLVAAGFEAVHWSNIGALNAADNELMTWASEKNHVILTADLDFGAILAATRGTRPSVVQVRNDLLTPQAIGSEVVTAIRQTEADLAKGALVSVDTSRARLRILPLGQ
jgi:predicted nuclease of predicted toxin-antitoxin system